MRIRKLGVTVVAAAAVVFGTAVAVHAATTSDTEDHFSKPAGTIISAKAGTSTTVACPAGSVSAPLVFCGSIDGVPIWVKCTGFSASGKIPTGNSLTVTLSAAPKFTGCSDSTKSADTITTNTTNGKWTLHEVDGDGTKGESAPEPNSTGDKATLSIPKGGATFDSAFLPACVVLVAPTARANLTGTFNDSTTIKDKSATLPVAPKTSGSCTTGTTTVTGTILLTTSIHDVS